MVYFHNQIMQAVEYTIVYCVTSMHDNILLHQNGGILATVDCNHVSALVPVLVIMVLGN